MLTTLLGIDTGQDNTNRKRHKEGDLFKVITAYGKTFEIRYGYYEECDRNLKDAEPMEIYPNFIQNPHYTDKGIPFVTEMQEPCEFFDGKKDENSGCGDCTFYNRCEELLGICKYPANKNTNKIKE